MLAITISPYSRARCSGAANSQENLKFDQLQGHFEAIWNGY